MRKLIGILLIVLAIGVLGAFTGASVSPSLSRAFARVFCASGEQLEVFSTGDSRDSNTTVYCATEGGARRDVTIRYFIALFASFLIPLYLGRRLYSGGK